jgi:dihydroorotase
MLKPSHLARQAPGASGVDTLLALTLTLVHQNHITLSRAIELLSLAPSTILDIDGGSLMPGASANFMLFRPDSSWIITGADFASHSRITPFESHPVQGVVDLTYINGEQIYPATALD